MECAEHADVQILETFTRALSTAADVAHGVFEQALSHGAEQDHAVTDFACQLQRFRPAGGDIYWHLVLQVDPSASRIGIEVSNGRSELKSGVRLAGIEIYQVLRDSPGQAVGLQGRRAAVALVALTVGGLFFPPTAVLGAMVMKQSGIGEPHQLIIAVDA